MDKERLKEQWLKEERAAHIQGWDFSHIQGRYEEENDLPWSYRAVIEQYLESREIIFYVVERLKALCHNGFNTCYP